MFDAYGQSPTPSRLETYCDVIGEHLPTSAVLVGIRDAMREAGDYPPGPGSVRKAALAAARLRAGDPPPPIDLPQEAGRRDGWRPLAALLTAHAPQNQRSDD